MKKVILEQADTINFNNVEPENKAYYFHSFGSVYKLHRLEPDNYAFVGLDESICYANGVFDSAQKAIESTLQCDNEIYEIGSISDLIKFLEGIK